jgi:ATP-dependent DNA helicase RecQ
MTDALTQQEARRWLRRALNHPQADFHPGQWEAIEALVQHRQKLLVVQRTGWGRSWCIS